MTSASPDDVTPSITVVIPARNAASTIDAQLAALARQRIDDAFEIVVVDNGSTDDTALIATKAPVHPRCALRVVREPRPGLNVARNAGVRSARGPSVAICDADDIVADDWLTKLSAALGEYDLVTGSLAFSEINDVRTLELRGWAGRHEPARSVGREFGFLDQLICGNVAFRRVVWDTVGGFDEGFARGGDDVDFSWRVQLAGFRVGEVPEAVLNYRGRSDVRTMFRQYVRDGEGGAHLYAVYRAHGMPRRRICDALREIGWLTIRIPTIPFLRGAPRGHLVRASGKQWGRIRGSLRHRVLYL